MPKLEQDLFRFLKANLLEEDEDGQRLATNFVHMPAIASYCAHLCLALAFESCARKTTMWEKTSTQIHWGHTCLCIFSGTTIFHLTRLLSFLSAHRYSYLQSYYITYIYTYIYIYLSLSLFRLVLRPVLCPRSIGYPDATEANWRGSCKCGHKDRGSTQTTHGTCALLSMESRGWAGYLHLRPQVIFAVCNVHMCQ